MKLGRGRGGGAGRDPQGAACGLALAAQVPATCRARSQPAQGCPAPRPGGSLWQGAPLLRVRARVWRAPRAPRASAQPAGTTGVREGGRARRFHPHDPRNTHAQTWACALSAVRPCGGCAIEVGTDYFKTTLSTSAPRVNHKDGLKPGYLGFKLSCSHSLQRAGGLARSHLILRSSLRGGRGLARL